MAVDRRVVQPKAGMATLPDDSVIARKSWETSGVLFTVDLGGIEDTLRNDFGSLGSNLAEKAASVAFVAGRAADLLDLKQERVGVAVDQNLTHPLHVPAFFAFAPE